MARLTDYYNFSPEKMREVGVLANEYAATNPNMDFQTWMDMRMNGSKVVRFQGRDRDWDRDQDRYNSNLQLAIQLSTLELKKQEQKEKKEQEEQKEKKELEEKYLKTFVKSEVSEREIQHLKESREREIQHLKESHKHEIEVMNKAAQIERMFLEQKNSIDLLQYQLQQQQHQLNYYRGMHGGEDTPRGRGMHEDSSMHGGDNSQGGGG
jgi:hypothetical protein